MDQAVRSRLPRGLGEAGASLVCFLVVLGALVAVDDRVRARLALELSPGQVSTWTDRLGTVAKVLMEAARDHSLAQAPLMVFSVVAFVLLMLMLRK